MKKRILVFSMVLALTAVMAMPTAAGAGDTVISGTIETTATLIVPTDITFTTFTTGTNTGSSGTAGSVSANAAGWTLTVSDAKETTESGFMIRSDGTNLGSKIQVGMTAETVTTIALYQAQLLAVGTYSTTSPFSIPLFAKQIVATDDLPGVYSITLTYEVTPAE